MMFRGKFIHTMNAQRRVSLPAKWRALLEVKYNKKLILVGGDGKEKIVAYPEPAYEEKEKEDMKLPVNVDQAVDDQLLDDYSDVSEVELDGQGRILIPEEIAADLGLEKEVLFVGVTNKIFIYNPKTYAEVRARARVNREPNKQRVAEVKQALGVPTAPPVPRPEVAGGEDE